MLEVFQIIFLRTIAVFVATIILILLIFRNGSIQNFIENESNKIQKFQKILYILIGIIFFISSLNITLRIVYIGCNTAFLLNILIFLINLRLNKLTKLGLRIFIGTCIGICILQFIYPILSENIK